VILRATHEGALTYCAGVDVLCQLSTRRARRKVATPWARAGSGFTLLFEAYVLALAKTMPIANAAERLGEHDTRLWRIVEHNVWRAVEKLDLSLVRRIAADETSARRGHDYISLFVDMARREVVNVADGKDAATREGNRGFPRGAWRPAGGGDRRQQRHGGCIRGGDKRELPQRRDHVRQIFTSSNSQTRPSTGCGARRRGTSSRSRAGATSS
jgi:Helix-turn-helix domain of transposase family ISL3